MKLAEILSRIEMRLKALGISANEASRRAGKSDAIRNLRRAVAKGEREGISTATLMALAPVLETTAPWLLTGGASPEEVAEEAVSGSLSYEEALTALAWAFEAP